MPAKVQFGQTEPKAPTGKTSLIFLPKRSQALSSLRAGERLSVEVLDKFADGKVMLKIKGAAVTAQTKGGMQVGEKVQVLVERTGSTYVLRRINVANQEIEQSLARVVRTRVAGFQERSAALLSLLHSQAIKGLAGMKANLATSLTRVQQQLGELLVVDDQLAGKLTNLATLLGLSPAGAGERLREAAGRNLPGRLQRILSADKGAWAKLLQLSPDMTAEEAEHLAKAVGQLKEQIGLFRALNGLLQSRDLPQFLSMPLVFNGEPQPTDLWVYKRYDAEKSEDAEDVTSAYIKLRLSNLGEIRALVLVNGNSVKATIYTEKAASKEVIGEALPDLADAMRNAGLTPQLALKEGMENAPDQDLNQLLFGSGENRVLSLKV